MEPRFDMWSPSEVRSAGNSSRKRELSLLPYTGCRYDFKSVQGSNQYDQFSELGQHEYSCRGIWSRVLTCDHLPRAVVHGIRRGSGNYRYCVTRGGGWISKVCRDLINSIRSLSQVNMKSRVLVYVAYGAAIWHVINFQSPLRREYAAEEGSVAIALRTV